MTVILANKSKNDHFISIQLPASRPCISLECQQVLYIGQPLHILMLHWLWVLLFRCHNPEFSRKNHHNFNIFRYLFELEVNQPPKSFKPLVIHLLLVHSSQWNRKLFHPIGFQQELLMLIMVLKFPIIFCRQRGQKFIRILKTSLSKWNSRSSFFSKN